MILVPLLIPIAVLFSFLVLYAMAQSSNQLGQAIVEIVQHTVGRIFIIGRFINKGVEWASQAISDVLGRAASGMQHRVGGMFHTLAHVVTETGDKIERAFALIYALTRELHTFVTWHNVQALLRATTRPLHQTTVIVREHTRVIPKTITRIERVGKVAAHAAAQAAAIPADVVLPRDLAPIRERVRAVEDELAELWKRARGIAIPSIAGIGLGALAFALGRLGIGWARCSNVGKVGRRICGMDSNLLESLLLDTLAIVGTVSLVEFIRDAQAIEDVALDALSGFIREFPKV